MPTANQFRLLLVTSVALGIVGGVVDLVFPGLLPEALAQAVESQTPPDSDLFVFGLGGVGVGLFIALVACPIGLYRFKPWAPRLATASTGLALLVGLVVGPSAQSGVAITLYELSSMLWGAVLAIAYFSPLSERFAGGDA